MMPDLHRQSFAVPEKLGSRGPTVWWGGVSCSAWPVL